MKKYLLQFSLLIIIGLMASPAWSQQSRTFYRGSGVPVKPHSFPREQGTPAMVSVNQSPIAGNSLPLSITLPGNVLSIQGTWPQQSNTRGLHNIQVDPSNPSNIHAVITANADLTGDNSDLPDRRCYYTFSHDGGVTWSTPVIFGKFRTGYADMKLMLRNGQYVPVIAAHMLTSVNSSDVTCGLWIEKGNPGDGHFAACIAPFNGSTIIWPNIAISPDQKKVYMAASVSPATGGSPQQLQFGIWTLNESQDSATFGGWNATPGSGDQNNPNAGVTSGGAYRVAVSQSGNVGIFWLNTSTAGDPTDQALFFVQSNDGGVTWPTTMTYIAEAPGSSTRQETDNQGFIYSWTPGGSIDMWYDGDNPQFVYGGYYLDAGDNVFIPASNTLYYVGSTDLSDTIPIANVLLTAGPGTIPNSLDVHTGVLTDMQSNEHIEFTSVARLNSSIFAVFYQAFIEGDTQDFQLPDNDTIYPYGNIFYSLTYDHGQTWSDPTPVLVYSGSGQPLDYRYPQTSDFNPTSGSSGTFHILFSVDTAAGIVQSVAKGATGFDVISYSHMAVTIPTNGVASQAQMPTLNLLTNYPNPANGLTTISFTLKSDANVTLIVEDMLGRPLSTIINGHLGAGMHSAVFNGANLPSGVYRYTLRADGESVSRSMSLLK
jgi:hypothetical protein